MLRKNLDAHYSPLFFLGSLGAGGLSVSFFMYLMFMVDHPDTPLPTYSHIMPLLQQGSPVARTLVALALMAILVLAFQHLRLLVWNIREYRRFRQTDAFQKLISSNNEVALMAIPLTLAMTINVGFVLGAVFVPHLWEVVEYLFPFAILGFLAVGIYALKIFTHYMTRLITAGDFDFVENNSLSQMIAIFAFAMVSVGLAAPGAMSHHVEVNAIGIFFAIFFAAIAMVLGLLKFVLGIKSIFRHGISEAASPSLWIVIPILTLLGIAFIRMSFGVHHGFGDPAPRTGLFILTSTVLSLQLMAGLIGYAVMKRLNYFADYLHGDKRHAGSYALICPGVALFVFGMFFIHMGLVHNGLLEKFGVTYFIMLLPLLYLQFRTLLTLLTINKRLLRPESSLGQSTAAE